VKLSVVGTLYKSVETLHEFVERASIAARQAVGDSYEIILVVDGDEESLIAAKQLPELGHHVVVVDLSRNFGHHKAMMTGLEHSLGDLVFLIDTDLEEEPEWLLTFLSLIEEHQVDVVCGVQEKRRGRLFERISGYWFYFFFSRLTGFKVRNNVTARLMTRRYVNSLLEYKETEVVLGGLWALTGYAQIPALIQKGDSSRTTYPIRKRLSVAVESIVSFSNLPLVWSFYFSVAIFVGSVGFLAVLMYLYFAGAESVDGYLSVIASVWVFSALVLLSQGIQNFYIATIFSEVKNRPRSIVRSIYGRGTI
jgi:putative glycosyltransferase